MVSPFVPCPQAVPPHLRSNIVRVRRENSEEAKRPNPIN